ncbi:MAG: SDR family NAD(P)-dependent oxidoreductase [Hyphomicrobiaceae bacterium]
MDKERPHCLVIGVGPGTGLACVRRFVDEGYKISMIARHEGRLESWAKEIPHTVGYPTNLTDLAHSRATLEQIKAEQGLPRVIIYNASLATFAHYSELDVADFERNFRANTTGLLVTAQVFGPDMVEAGGGSIVITGNTSARRGIPRFVGFAPTKASQMILGESLARELGPKNVHVAYVMIDAMIDMPMVRKRLPDEPAESFAQPTDIAGEVFHIAHQPRSTWSYLHEIRPFGEKW